MLSNSVRQVTIYLHTRLAPIASRVSTAEPLKSGAIVNALRSCKYIGRLWLENIHFCNGVRGSIR